MATLGHQDGRNFDLDERWGENSREVLERLVLEAMQRGRALLFGTSGDPIELGIAKSLARPSGNFTQCGARGEPESRQGARYHRAAGATVQRRMR
jgi:hypothetical protein